MNDEVLDGPSLVVTWNHEAGGLAERVVDSLGRTLGLEPVGDIDPPGFFSLEGVAVSEDVIQFPVTRFYSCRGANLVVLQSDAPTRDHYGFLTSLLDFAVHRCQVSQVFTIGGVVSALAHTSPRRVFGIVNQPDLKAPLTECDVETGMDYETPSRGSTSLSNFLLWVAKTRKLPGCTLWAEVPFYLAATRDPVAAVHILRVLQNMFRLTLDLEQLDHEKQEIEKQIQELRAENTEVARCIELLERGIMLSESESDALTKDVSIALRRRAWWDT